jgi:hypothetical protein
MTAVRTQQLAGADLSKFQGIVLPEAVGEGYAAVLGANGARRLHDWVQAGGTLIGIGSALSYLGSAGFLAISRENAPGAPGSGSGGGRGGRGAAAGGEASAPAEGRGGAGAVAGQLFATESDMEKATQPDAQAPWPAHGFLAKAKVNPEHWIAAGVPETVYTLVSGSNIYTPLKVNQGINAAYFAAADQVMASGYSWEEFRKQLAFKPLVVVERAGRGNVIGFTADPNYRASLDGMNLLFLNAIFRGAAHAGVGGRGGREER